MDSHQWCGSAFPLTRCGPRPRCSRGARTGTGLDSWGRARLLACDSQKSAGPIKIQAASFLDRIEFTEFSEEGGAQPPCRPENRTPYATRARVHPKPSWASNGLRRDIGPALRHRAAMLARGADCRLSAGAHALEPLDCRPRVQLAAPIGEEHLPIHVCKDLHLMSDGFGHHFQ